MPGVEVTFMFPNVRDDVMEAIRNEQQALHLWLALAQGILSRRPALIDQTDEHEACECEARARAIVDGASSRGGRSCAGRNLGDCGASDRELLRWA
jgi:hypothetical protein